MVSGTRSRPCISPAARPSSGSSPRAGSSAKHLLDWYGHFLPSEQHGLADVLATAPRRIFASPEKSLRPRTDAPTRAPRRRLTLAGNHAWAAALFRDGDDAAFERYQSAYSTAGHGWLMPPCGGAIRVAWRSHSLAWCEGDQAAIADESNVPSIGPSIDLPSVTGRADPIWIRASRRRE